MTPVFAHYPLPVYTYHITYCEAGWWSTAQAPVDEDGAREAFATYYRSAQDVRVVVIVWRDDGKPEAVNDMTDDFIEWVMSADDRAADARAERSAMESQAQFDRAGIR